MADELRIGLQQLLCKAQIEGDADFLKEGVRVLAVVQEAYVHGVSTRKVDELVEASG